jgi:hypothetical protein
MKEPKQICCVLATDWSFYETQASIDSDFTPIDALIVGFVIHEDDDTLVMSHQYFPDQAEVRHTTVITKSSILQRYHFTVEEAEVVD